MRDNSNRVPIYLSPQLQEERQMWKDAPFGGFASRLTDVLNRLQYVVCEHMPQFSRDEWCLIIDALNGYHMADSIIGIQGVPFQISEALHGEELGDKWGVEPDQFLDRVDRLMPVEIVAVAEAASLFWNGQRQNLDEFIAKLQAKPCQLYQPQ